MNGKSEAKWSRSFCLRVDFTSRLFTAANLDELRAMAQPSELNRQIGVRVAKTIDDSRVYRARKRRGAFTNPSQPQVQRKRLAEPTYKLLCGSRARLEAVVLDHSELVQPYAISTLLIRLMG